MSSSHTHVRHTHTHTNTKPAPAEDKTLKSNKTNTLAYFTARQSLRTVMCAHKFGFSVVNIIIVACCMYWYGFIMATVEFNAPRCCHLLLATNKQTTKIFVYALCALAFLCQTAIQLRCMSHVRISTAHRVTCHMSTLIRLYARGHRGNVLPSSLQHTHYIGLLSRHTH